jgi:ribonuclease HI
MTKNNEKSSGGKCRGVIFRIERIKEITFAWGIGTSTNNVVEALDLFQGMCILRDKGIHKAMVVGDLAIMIKSLHHCSPPKNFNVYQIIQRILQLAQDFKRLEFHHMLQRKKISSSMSKPTKVLGW